jgi:sulfur carrier protein ThiS adenylyltransferase
MNNFQRAIRAKLGSNQWQKLQQYKIGIAGAGGLGSNCACNLVRSGFEHLVIADFDRVEASNLNRQFYFANQVGQPKVVALEKNLSAINSNLQLAAKNLKLTASNSSQVFADCDVIVEACDLAATKKMIVEEFIDQVELLIAASGLAGWGASDQLTTKQLKDNFYLVGDLSTEVSVDNPPIAPRVNLVAAKQANLILNYVLKD